MKKNIILSLLVAFLLSTSACAMLNKRASDSTPSPEEIAQQAKEALIEELGATPNAEASDQGSDQYQYEDVSYLDYNGKEIYYITDGVKVFVRWESEALDEKEAKQLYQKAMEEEGKNFDNEGTEASEGTDKSYALSSQTGTVTIAMNVQEDKSYMVTVIRTGDAM